ncbi:MAG: hypothetical protein K6A40_05945 [Solobacterium sp.]|nr:hypothetical protein [Solobacterium sp.]
MSEEGRIRTVPAVCTQCGAKLDVDPEKDAAVCPYCGTPFLVDKAIQNYNINYTHNDVHQDIHIQNGKRGAVDSALDFIHRQTKQQNEYQLEQQRLEFEKEKYYREKREAARSSFWKKAGWFFGFLICFPIPVMIILNRKTNMDPKKKYGIIAACWIVYLLIGLGGNRSSSGKTAEPTSAPTPIPAAVTPTPTPSEAPQQVTYKDDFSKGTKKITIDGYIFEIPESWKAADNKVILNGSGYDETVFWDTLDVSEAGFLNSWKNPDSFVTGLTKNYSNVRDSRSFSSEHNGVKDLGASFAGTDKNGQDVMTEFHVLYGEGQNTPVYIAYGAGTSNTVSHLWDYHKILQSVSCETKPSAEPAAGIRPEFKEQMEAYEAFFDEYIAFMKTYDSTNTSAAYLQKYMDFMTKYTDYMEKMDNVDESSLSPEEDKYYLEVTMRIEKKLLEALNN